MTDEPEVSPEQTEALYRKLREEAEASGYHLNPDVEFTPSCMW